MKRCLLTIAAIGSLVVHAKKASAGIVDYLKAYRLGGEIAKDYGSIGVVYNTNSDVPLDPRKCEKASGSTYKCKASVPIDSNYGPGLTFEQPFERKGIIHYDFDFDFVLRRFVSKSQSFDTDADIPPGGYALAPMRSMGLNLTGINSDAYLEFGLTPKGPIPDLIFDVGVGLQPLYGSVEFNGVTKYRFFINSLIYLEGDLVLARFGKAGAVTIYASGEAGSSSINALAVEGMANFQLEIIKKSFGLSVLTNFP